MARRRTPKYGAGGIYPDPQRPGHKIVQVPDGHGKYIRRRAVDSAAAKAAYAEIKRRLSGDLDPRTGTCTLDAFVQEWRTRVIEPRQKSVRPLAPKTVEAYRVTIIRYLLPDWGECWLEDIDARLVLEMFHTLRERHSDYIAHRALTLLHMLMQVALRWHYIDENPVEVARPDIPPYQTVEKPALTPEESARVLRAVAGHRLELLYRTALTLGLRPGELLGLQWGDIDWAARTIRVCRQVQDVEGQQTIRNSTKYGDGHRTLPLPPVLLERLAAQPRVTDHIFPNARGTGYIRPRAFNIHFAGGLSRRNRKGEDRFITGIRARAGLPSTFTPHCFRHTVATRMMELSIQDEIRDAIMGHGKTGIRQRYTHVRLDVMRASLEAVEQALEAALQQFPATEVPTWDTPRAPKERAPKKAPKRRTLKRTGARRKPGESQPMGD